jgi:malate synthase
MEDAATAEICRSQIWQWLKNRVALNDGRLVTPEFVENILESEKVSLPATENSLKAFNIFKKLTFDSQFEDFLTSGAYDMLVAGGA